MECMVICTIEVVCNFHRFAKYHQKEDYDSRDFIKAYGILFKVEVTGTVSNSISFLIISTTIKVEQDEIFIAGKSL